MHPAYRNSTLVSRAAMASRLIVTTSDHLSNMMQAGAETFTQRTKASPKPLTFTPTTHDRVRKINAFTQGAAGLSAKTVGQVSKYAQNLGATMARRGGAGKERGGADGRPYKPGILNKSLIAFSTVADGIDQSARNLLTSGSAAATTMVGHRYGNDAREVTRQLAGGVKNVGLVYVDASGVSRKAIVKSVAKGMVLGRVKGGGTVVVGGGDEAQLLASSSSSSSAPPYAPNVGGAGSTARPTEVGFGNAAPPLYGGSGVGEQLGGAAAQGYETNVKR
jgi:spartin